MGQPQISPVGVDRARDVVPLVDNAERQTHPVVILTERWGLEKTGKRNEGTGADTSKQARRWERRQHCRNREGATNKRRWEHFTRRRQQDLDNLVPRRDVGAVNKSIGIHESYRPNSGSMSQIMPVTRFPPGSVR